ncbi:hypothetical protein ACS0TY_010309 [Phlomoides rotata]
MSRKVFQDALYRKPAPTTLIYHLVAEKSFFCFEFRERIAPVLHLHIIFFISDSSSPRFFRNQGFSE